MMREFEAEQVGGLADVPIRLERNKLTNSVGLFQVFYRYLSPKMD